MLITFNDDVVRMTECFLRHKVVVLCFLSFANANARVAANVGEVDKDGRSDDEERMMNVMNDPFWKSLMSNDDDDWDAAGEPGLRTSTHGDDTSTYDNREGGDERVMMGMVMRRMEDVSDAGDGDEHNEFDAHDTTHVGGLSHTTSFGVRMLEGEEEDEVSSKLGTSDILASPPNSDDENEVGSRCCYHTQQ